MPWCPRLPDVMDHPVNPPTRRPESAAGGGPDISAWIGAVRSRLAILTLARATLGVGAAVCLGLGLSLGLDFFLDLPRWARALTGMMVVGLTIGTIWRLGWRGLRAVPRQDALALWVERQRPDFRSRLISSVQLARMGWDTPEARAFVARMQADVGDAARGVPVGEVAPTDDLRRSAGRAVPVLIGFLLWLAWLGPTRGVLWRRALLDEVALPRRTQIREVTGPLVVGRGDDVTLKVSVGGVVPRSGRLTMKQESGRVQELPFDAESPGSSSFARLIGGVPSSFRYHVRLNDAETPEFLVEVLPRPLVTNLVLTQILPAYTGALPRRLVPGELSILRGSRVRVQGAASQPLREARVRLAGVDRVVGLTVSAGAADRVEGEVLMDTDRINGFSIELVDQHGIPSRDPAVYALNVVEDKAPEVRVVMPSRREDLVTTRGTELLAFEAKDDFGIGALRLRYEPASSTNGNPSTVELDLGGETNGVVRRRFEWKLGSLQPPLAEGSMVEFWVEAVDRNDVDGPKVGRSDRYLLRVVTEAEKRADLLGRAGDAIGRLGDVAQGQERLNDSLGRLILAKPSAP